MESAFHEAFSLILLVCVLGHTKGELLVDHGSAPGYVTVHGGALW